MKTNELVKSLVIIPGSGEFVYSPSPVAKNGYRVNVNNPSSLPDIKYAVGKIKTEFPNVENLSIVIDWFASSLDVDTCTIRPLVESKTQYHITPKDWQVAGFTRQTAGTVCNDHTGNIAFGGTPSDDSIAELSKYLHELGYNVMLYPRLLINQPHKPWRGEMLPQTKSGLDRFFKQEYNPFIKHYAKIKEHIDSFVIGSELIKITSFMDGNSFPAIEHFKELAKDVKSSLGPNIKITYAANWGEEYHHISGGYKPLHELWVDDNIDVISIDAYFPLTEKPNPTVLDIYKGWQSGENYNYYYDWEGEQKSMDPIWGCKAIEIWYKANNYNKPVWLTEYGFPSIKDASKKPYDYTNLQSKETSFEAQETAICASELFFKESIIQRAYLYAVDARYNFYDHPQRWKDAGEWKNGHWVNDKLKHSGECSLGHEEL